MAEHSQSADQPVGFALPNWNPPPRPAREPMVGQLCQLEPIDPTRHAEPLYESFAQEPDRIWTYMGYGPFRTVESYRAWIQENCLGEDPLFFAIRRLSDGKLGGVASFLRITPSSGSIEVGHILYSASVQRSPAATEAMYLMMKRAFELGYRRYEWKCDSLNAPSRRAAQRLGLSFEGVFRQATVYKGRNRDTAWYAAIDSEWPSLQEALLTWLDPSNFDSSGQQRRRLSDLTRPILKQIG
jgi:RimJ/RimL family protein N-acetyltransferase